MLSNNDGNLATSDTSRVTDEIIEELRQGCYELLDLLAPTFERLSDNPSLDILMALGERPISLMRCSGYDWKEIESSLSSRIANDAPGVDETDRRLMQRIELGEWAGISSTDAREEGCKEAIAKHPDVTLVGVDYNDDDPSKAQAQVEAMLQKEADLAGIFGTNVFSAQGAGQVVANKGLSGKVKVVAFDATETAIEMLKAKTVDMVIAQKPADMGYFAVEMAMAHMNGVTSLPRHIPTGYQVITRDNMNQPDMKALLSPDLAKYLQ